MSAVFETIHTAADRYPADARFDDASLAPTAEELAQDRKDLPTGAVKHDDPDKQAADKELEKALKDSFPASDPVSVANGTVAGAPDPATGKPARPANGTNGKPPVD
jgi:hypothetical protein